MQIATSKVENSAQVLSFLAEVCPWLDQRILKGQYHFTIDLLFDWFGLVCFVNKNKNCQLSYSWFQTSQTGGQRYSDRLIRLTGSIGQVVQADESQVGGIRTRSDPVVQVLTVLPGVFRKRRRHRVFFVRWPSGNIQHFTAGPSARVFCEQNAISINEIRQISHQNWKLEIHAYTCTHARTHKNVLEKRLSREY